MDKDAVIKLKLRRASNVESSVKKLRNEVFAKRYSFDTLEEAENYMHAQ